MSRVPPSWGRGSWFMGNQEVFKTYAGDNVFPRWLRVTYAAYSHVAANGHATFRHKDLAVILGEKDTNGLWIPTERQRVREAIDGAIDRGLLLDGSKALCLIVPPKAVAFGVGNNKAPCRRHPAEVERNAETVSFGVETTGFNRVVPPQKERQNRVVSRSALSLLSSNPTPAGERPAS